MTQGGGINRENIRKKTIKKEKQNTHAKNKTIMKSESFLTCIQNLFSPIIPPKCLSIKSRAHIEEKQNRNHNRAMKQLAMKPVVAFFRISHCYISQSDS